MNKWISVRDRLPPMDVRVLGCEVGKTTKEVIVRRIETSISTPGLMWCDEKNGWLIIPFWMPLPKPPEVSREEGKR